MIASPRFEGNTQDAIAHLDAFAFMDTFTEMLDNLREAASAPDRMITRWRRDDDGDPEV